jgi:type II secretory ATPase GspE/PulE/Tfp pilus assembly ATPase PilB-like protein
MFHVDDEVKQVILSGGSGSQLKALFRKQKARYLQEQALLVVEQGETSVQEVLRVLRIGQEPASGTKTVAM